MMWDREAYYDFLRSAPAVVATEVKRLQAERQPTVDVSQS